MDHIFFIHASFCGHLGCLHALVIRNSAAVNNILHPFQRGQVSGQEPPLPQQICKQGQGSVLLGIYRGPRLEAGLPGVAGAAEAPFQVGGDGRRVGLSPGAARLPAPRRALVGSVLALPFQTAEPSLAPWARLTLPVSPWRQSAPPRGLLTQVRRAVCVYPRALA